MRHSVWGYVHCTGLNGESEREAGKEGRREVDTLEEGREKDGQREAVTIVTDSEYQLPTGRDSEEAATSSDLRPMVSVYTDTTQLEDID